MIRGNKAFLLETLKLSGFPFQMFLSFCTMQAQGKFKLWKVQKKKNCCYNYTRDMLYNNIYINESLSFTFMFIFCFKTDLLLIQDNTILTFDPINAMHLMMVSGSSNQIDMAHILYCQIGLGLTQFQQWMHVVCVWSSSETTLNPDLGIRFHAVPV